METFQDYFLYYRSNEFYCPYEGRYYSVKERILYFVLNSCVVRRKKQKLKMENQIKAFSFRADLKKMSNETLTERSDVYKQRIEQLLTEKEKIEGAIDTIDEIISCYSDEIESREL